MSKNNPNQPLTWLDIQAELLTRAILRQIKRIRISDTIKSYMMLVACVTFVFVTIAAIITLSFHIVLGSVVLGAGLGYLVYTGAKQ